MWCKFLKIIVDRFHSNRETTLSRVTIDGVFVCFGLEDEYRAIKVAGETRIPAGDYNVTMRNIGGFDNRYKKKFDFHLGMLQVQNVPNFEYILIHIGNTDKNTAGCLLIGEGAIVSDKINIQYSTNAYVKFYKKVVNACLNRELTIEYQDNDGEGL